MQLSVSSAPQRQRRGARATVAALAGAALLAMAVTDPVAAATQAAAASVQAVQGPEIPDQYIVLFKDTATRDDIALHHVQLATLLSPMGAAAANMGLFGMTPAGNAPVATRHGRRRGRNAEPVDTVTSRAWALSDVTSFGHLLHTYGIEDAQSARLAAAAHGQQAPTGHLLKGYAARIPAYALPLLKRAPEVALVEPDRVWQLQRAVPAVDERAQVSVDAMEQWPEVDPIAPEQFYRIGLDDTHKWGEQPEPPSWGLTRLSSKALPAAGSAYLYPPSAGTGVTAYVVDTGINIKHPDLEGRAIWGKTFANDGDTDKNGHGSHVAGTIGGHDHGVAKNVTLVAVKVLNGQGSGTTSGVLAGIDWTAADHARRTRERGDGKQARSVANMSLGGGASVALDRATAAAVRAGVAFAVAAGNSAGDACRVSPARVNEAVTVAASDRRDTFAYFSEKGPCVDIVAPGVDITSIWIDEPGAGHSGKAPVNTISGTSMATPHVCGVMALVLSERGDEIDAKIAEATQEAMAGAFMGGSTNSTLKTTYPAYVKAFLHELASPDLVKGPITATTPNLLLNTLDIDEETLAEPDWDTKKPTPGDGNGDGGDDDDDMCDFPECLFRDCTCRESVPDDAFDAEHLAAQQQQKIQRPSTSPNRVSRVFKTIKGMLVWV